MTITIEKALRIGELAAQLHKARRENEWAMGRITNFSMVVGAELPGRGTNFQNRVDLKFERTGGGCEYDHFGKVVVAAIRREYANRVTRIERELRQLGAEVPAHEGRA